MRSRPVQILVAPVLVALATWIGIIIDTPATGARGSLLILAVLGSALVGRIPGLVAAALGAASLSYFFLPPIHQFSIGRQEELLAFVIFVVVALVVSTLVSRTDTLRRQAEAREADAIRALELAEQLSAAEARARDAQVAAELSAARAAFFAAAGHDLRTPLAGVAAAAAALLAEGEHLSDADRRALLEDIRDEADRLSRLVTRVLSLGRVRAGIEPSPEPVEVVALVQAAVRRLQPVLGDHPVGLEIADEASVAELDVTMTEEILVNLLENAARFSPPGSSIEVRASRAHEGIVVSVRDHGPGFARDEHDLVFEEYRRGAASAGVPGTGLGLTIVRAMCEAQGGRVEIGDAADGGALVRCHLPTRLLPSEPPAEELADAPVVGDPLGVPGPAPVGAPSEVAP